MAAKDKPLDPDWPELRAFSATLDERIGEMRRMLVLMKPASTAGALKALRDSFPDVPLDERVRALAATLH